MLSYILMNLRHLKNLFNIVCLLQFLAILPVAASGDNKGLQNSLPFRFINNRILHLRNNNLAKPEVIEVGSQINIDTKFLLEHLGTENPNQEQVQRLLLNPGEISKERIVTQRFINASNGKPKNDYFFPVSIQTKSGKIKTGKIALHAYNRTGVVEIKRADGSDPRQFQSSEVTAQMQELINQNKSTTEAQACTDCSAKNTSQTQGISDIANALDSNSQTSSNALWAKYKDFAKEFSTTNKNISRARAGYYKRLYIKSLIEQFGEKDTGLILAALTGYGEAPYRRSNEAQIAEFAAVLKVIDNRAENKFRRKSRTLRDIGVSESADSRLTTVLADWQFSAWNDKDDNLRRIMNFNPETVDKTTKRTMALSFEAQSMIQTGKVEFLGKMNDSKLHHYHANYASPNWSKTNKRVNAPIIKVDGIEVDLSKKKGIRHIFYTGIS